MSNHGGLILLVEDDPSLRGSMVEFLHDHGYQTLAAGSIAEAIGLLREARPTVCLLDLNLPDGNGLELFKTAAVRERGLRVIVMTAFPLQHLRPTDANGSLVAWMTKPVAPPQLLQALRSAMSQPHAATRPNRGKDGH